MLSTRSAAEKLRVDCGGESIFPPQTPLLACASSARPFSPFSPRIARPGAGGPLRAREAQQPPGSLSPPGARWRPGVRNCCLAVPTNDTARRGRALTTSRSGNRPGDRSIALEALRSEDAANSLPKSTGVARERSPPRSAPCSLGEDGVGVPTRRDRDRAPPHRAGGQGLRAVLGAEAWGGLCSQKCAGRSPPRAARRGRAGCPAHPGRGGGGEEKPRVCTAKFDCRTTVRLRDLA